MPAIGDRLTIDPPPFGDHGRDRVFDAEEYAGRVDRYDPVPGFGAVKILFGAAGDAGIVTSTSSSPKCRVVAVTTAAQLSSFVMSSGSNRAEAPIASTHLPSFVLRHVGDHHFGGFAPSLVMHHLSSPAAATRLARWHDLERQRAIQLARPFLFFVFAPKWGRRPPRSH
jgi:hypothetical protein